MPESCGVQTIKQTEGWVKYIFKQEELKVQGSKQKTKLR